MAGSELDVSALYGLPLSEFTSARNELAKQARAQGEAEEAERIKGLQKPSLVAWVLNMLPRLREGQMAELLQAGEQAEAAQSALLAGSGDPAELREASDRLRRAVRDLAGEAGEILVKGGHAAREQTSLRVRGALETAAVTAEGRRQLQAGEFEEAPEPAGFDLFAGLSSPTARRATRRPARGRDQAEERRQAREAVESARATHEERRAARVEADAATRAAEREARTKQREAEEAWQRVERARERAREAQAAEVEAKQLLDEAREQHRNR